MTKRTFYKTKIVIDIISEAPIPSNYSLVDIGYDITSGHNSGSWDITEVMELNGLAAARELKNQGSDPEFFQIDEEGNDLIAEGDTVEVENEDGTTWMGNFYQHFNNDIVIIKNEYDGELIKVPIDSVTLYN